jgi:hypothetical protein
VNTTTLKTIRDDVITQILGVTPNHTAYSGSRWHEIGNQDPDGAGTRGFRVVVIPPSADDDDGDGWYGCGLSFVSEVQVRTSYRDIREDQLAEITTQDEIDLWQAIRPRIDPAFAGVFWWRHLGFEQQSDEPPHWGIHLFECRWFADANP